MNRLTGDLLQQARQELEFASQCEEAEFRMYHIKRAIAQLQEAVTEMVKYCFVPGGNGKETTMYENEKEIAMRVAAKVYDGPLKGGAVIRMHRFVEELLTEIGFSDLRAYCEANPVVVSDEDIIARKEWQKKLLRSE
jgi:hypothetical protein